MNIWPSKKLRTLTTKIGSGATPRGGGATYVDSGISFIRSQNVLDHEMKLADIAHITDEAAHKLRGVTVEADDVLINITGDSIARCCVVDMAVLPARVNQHVAIIRTTSELDARFLQKFLVAPTSKELLIGISSGGTRKALTRSDLSNLDIPVPPLEIQQAIVEVLGALDDKIAANTKLASTTDHWVRVEYDLINRQSSEERAIGDFVTHRRKAVDPASLETSVPYVGLEHIPRRLMWLDSHGSSEDVTSNKSCFHAGDILFGKLRPYFHKVVTAPTSGICSTDVLVLVAKEESVSGYVLASLTHDDVIQTVTALSAGTRMPRTNWKDLSQVTIPWPGDLAATAFSERIQSIREYIIGLMAENEMLAETRDALLPQLMSGKLRVKDAEKVLEDAL